MSNGSKIDRSVKKALKQVNCSYTFLIQKGSDDPDENIKTLEKERKKLGRSRGKTNVLLVGKSLGGAKKYDELSNHTEVLKHYHRVGIVLVDPHEPGAPGDRGRAYYQYDYVKFIKNSRSKYRNYDLYLKPEIRKLLEKKYFIYVIYQRSKWPRGYSCSVLGKNCIRLSHSNHWKIASALETVNALGDCIIKVTS